MIYEEFMGTKGLDWKLGCDEGVEIWENFLEIFREKWDISSKMDELYIQTCSDDDNFQVQINPIMNLYG